MNIIHKLTGYRSRCSYWSNSKLSYAIQQLAGMKKQPTAATSKDWRLLDEHNKKVNSVVYWITEKLFDNVQNFLYFPYDVYHNFYAKYHNMFVSKMRYLDTKLPRTEYADLDTRILHGLMESVVHFIEYNKAGSYDSSCYYDEDAPKIKDRREAGLAYLDWEIALVMDEDYFGTEKDHPDFGKPTYQATAAQEMKDIYLWWKDVYPNRKDPMNESGWSAHCDAKQYPFEDNEGEDKKETKKILKLTHELEEEQQDEDTEMLCRVIKVRKSMWT